MKSSKQYFKYIDMIRVISCIAILLYHFNILKGGYLAVCTFFVLSGYLACTSAFTSKKFSLWKYYKTRLTKIYLPLLIVVFITIAVVSVFPNILWLNLKPETTSVLLGYNNFWQLSANLDYFARHVNSPFMHMWYIGILLQFELIFPFIFMLFKKAGEKAKKWLPTLISFIIGLLSIVFFIKMSLNNNIMATYYNSFTRAFSLFFGLALGFAHSFYKVKIPKRKFNKKNKIVFYIYLFILITMFIFIKADSILFVPAMILSTIISMRLIKYAILINNNKTSLITKIYKSLSSVSYEIYLLQYPIIFLFQYVDLIKYIEIPLIIIILLLLSYLLHFSLNFKNQKRFVLRVITIIIISIVAIYGACKYVVSKDYKEEMKLLEEQLLQNEKIFEEKQKEFEEQYKANQDKMNEALKDLENAEEDLKEIVTNLNVVGIGDSIMLGALKDLYQIFPNGFFDAKQSRTAWVVPGIIQDLKKKKIFGDPIVLNMGANGDAPDHIKDKIMSLCQEKEVFWVNVANNQNKKLNEKLTKLAEKYENLHIIDWNEISKGHNEYFIADKIHLTNEGRLKYAEAIYNSIYETYLEKYRNSKNEIIEQNKAEQKNKISFYGNNLLLNSFNYLSEDFSNDKFIIKDFSFKNLKDEIKKAKDNDLITNNIVLAFDYSLNLNKQQYEEIINIIDKSDLYILAINKGTLDTVKSLNNKNIKIINFYKKIKTHKNYLRDDKKHLSKEGNIALNGLLKEIFNK